MFDSIAQNYDFFNHFLSFGIDKWWRKKAVKSVGRVGDFPIVVDLATGTGDLAIQIYNDLKPEKIIGIDLSERMLEVAREKIAKLKLENSIELRVENGEQTSLPDNFCQLVTRTPVRDKRVFIVLTENNLRL